jgi:hypothetical protein
MFNRLRERSVHREDTARECCQVCAHPIPMLAPGVLRGSLRLRQQVADRPEIQVDVFGRNIEDLSPCFGDRLPDLFPNSVRSECRRPAGFSSSAMCQNLHARRVPRRRTACRPLPYVPIERLTSRRSDYDERRRTSARTAERAQENIPCPLGTPVLVAAQCLSTQQDLIAARAGMTANLVSTSRWR